VKDLAGNLINATSAGRDAFDLALRNLMSLRTTVGGDASRACEVDPTCTMAECLVAYLGLLSSERRDALAAGERLQKFIEQPRALNEREKLHIAAANCLADGDLGGASSTIAAINQTSPRDALAAFVGHQIDFFTGASSQLEARIASLLPHWSDDDPYIGYLWGMHAFGLEELGRYDEAIEAGERALERNCDDAWGIHAVTHVNEMRGTFEDGIDFLQKREHDWQTGTFLNVHLAWHHALFMLEREDWSAALSIYDRLIRGTSSNDIALELLDASSLLWRLHLDEVSVGDRWESLATGWETRLDEPWYVFNDMHAVMAFVGASRESDATEVIRGLEKYVSTPQSNTNWEMTRQIGLPVCRALLHHANGEFRQTALTLEPVLDQLFTFGGSHAQRDVVHRTYIDALVRDGQISAAQTCLQARLSDRPSSVWAKNRLASTQCVDGKTSR